MIFDFEPWQLDIDIDLTRQLYRSWELRVKLSDYVHWCNNFRIHSTLGYMSPVEFREVLLACKAGCPAHPPTADGQRPGA